jgi:putative ABC transport system permease protein
MVIRVKIALRQLLKTPGFTVIALITLALGIGVNTTAFAVLNHLILGSQPYPEKGRLVQVWSTTPQFQNGSIAPGDFCDFRDQSTSFAHLSVYYVNYQKSLAVPGKTPERSIAMAVTSEFFPTIGIGPLLGRTFTAEDQAKDLPLVVISHNYWQRQFAGDPAVLGRALRFDGRTVTIIGVMPPTLDDPQLWNGRLDLWHLDSIEVNRQVRDKAWYSLIGRLKPDATMAQAEAELKGIASRLAKDFPKTNDQRGARIEPYNPDYLGDMGRTLVWLIMALSVSVLLIACVNLANLQLVRASSRSREYAIRLALGASRRQLMRLLLTESLLLAGAGGIFGLLVAKWGNSYFAAFFGTPLPLNPRVLAYALLAATATGVASGLLPAWLGSRADVNAALKQSGRGSTADRSRHRLRHTLIVVEVALTLTLLTGAGFFIRGLQRITSRDLHWRSENVLTGSFELSYQNYGDEPNARHEVFTEKFLAALYRLPGVDHAAISHGTPAFGPGDGMQLAIEGQPLPPKGQKPVATLCRVTPGYFETYGIHLLQGRNFSETDRHGSPAVVIISQNMAKKFWPGENPVGKRFRSTDPNRPVWHEVVGVVSDVVFGVDFAGLYPPYHFYQPWAQQSIRFPTFSLHAVSDPRMLGDAVRKALASVEPDVAITQLSTAPEVLTQYLSGFSLVRQTLAILAGLGLLLSAVGIYGVIANLTAERTQEVGVRMALGAQPHNVLWLFLRNGIALALIGTGIGLFLSFGLMRLLSRSVMIVPGNDPWVIAGLATVLVIITLVACWLPARRATKVDPVIALRAD